jgi:hypothetical protein
MQLGYPKLLEQGGFPLTPFSFEKNIKQQYFQCFLLFLSIYQIIEDLINCIKKNNFKKMTGYADSFML